MELCSIIHSCQQFIASYSGFLALAFGMHASCTIGEFGPNELFCRDFEKVLPNVKLEKIYNF